MPPPTLATPSIFRNPKSRKPPKQRSRRMFDFTLYDDALPAITTALSSSNAHGTPKSKITLNRLLKAGLPGQSMFPSFLDNAPSTSSSANHSNTTSVSISNSSLPPRLAPSPMSQQQPVQTNGAGGGQMNGVNGGGVNGAGGAMAGLPMNAGQQMDVNLLWQKVVELSEILRDNRERTRGMVEGAGELAARATTNGASPQDSDSDTSALRARIAHLEHTLSQSQSRLSTTTRENTENTRLLGDYETTIGQIVEMVRNYAYSQKTLHSSLSTHYNKLLQEEKDAHLEARLERDEWCMRYGRVVEMLREGYRRRCEEDEGSVGVVRSLQEEVRAYRGVLGMEPERREEEAGWSVLGDAGGESPEGD